MPKRYEMWTVKDITDNVTEENLEGFLADFREYIKVGLEVKKLNDNLKGTMLEKEGITQITADRECFRWIDDGDYGRVSEVNMEVKTQKGPVKINVIDGDKQERLKFKVGDKVIISEGIVDEQNPEEVEEFNKKLRGKIQTVIAVEDVSHIKGTSGQWIKTDLIDKADSFWFRKV